MELTEIHKNQNGNLPLISFRSRNHRFATSTNIPASSIYHSTQLRLFSIAFRHPLILRSIPSRSMTPRYLCITTRQQHPLLLNFPLALDILQRFPISNSQSCSKARSKCSSLSHLRNDDIDVTDIGLELH